MEITKTYDPSLVEDKWYQYWLTHRLFAAKPDPAKEPYAIVIPPPNVTGQLHMGHMLNNTIQDILVRRARMQGKEACWVPGTDHASIATETKVVAMLRDKGIEKKSISREEFLKYAWEWKEKYGGIILEQLKKLGASCDWDRTRFTMEETLSESVIDVFLDLYNKGRIYRAYRMVNWDPKGKTALSDEEVVYKEVQSKLYYVRYQASPPTPKGGAKTPLPTGEGSGVGLSFGGGGAIVIATTRPETILADTAICVNPNDERYLHLHGKTVLVPFINREIPVITDEYVTMDFGTGALKITPAHDLNDYELGKKHNLPVIDILNEDGTLNEKCGVPEYVGKDRFAVRKQIARDIEEAGYLEKTEEYKSNVGYSERNPDTVVEPKVSLQWWLKMKDLAKPALDNVLNDTIQFHPARFKNMYRNWMENLHDWCISRQLWWGQRIPAWYDNQGNFVVAKNEAEALAAYRKQYPESAVTQLTQDEDVLDTWFSSWLWPMSVFDGLKDPGNPDINYFYPTNDLVTGPDIIFFWVARMIMAGYEYRDREPFRNVYFTGIIRDQYGRKMSKQLGNSPDPIALMERYGADGVRTGLLFSSPAGNDLIFDTPVPRTNNPEEIAKFQQDNDVLSSKLCEQGRNFNNKIWNAFRLVKGLTPGPSPKERGEDVVLTNTSFQETKPGWQTANPLLWEKLKAWGWENRRTPTEAEEKLWQELRNHKIGYKIRRQHTIESFIADFICIDKQLIIEVDGSVHKQPEQAEYDTLRTTFLSDLGYKIIRFSNDDVLLHLPQVLQIIKNELTQRSSYSELSRNATEVQNTPLLGRGAGGEASLKERLLPVRWFEARFSQKLTELEEHFASYRISDALLTVYNLAWDDFCSWYLEMIKPEFGQSISTEVYQATVVLFDKLLRVLHPFMPFVTEEIWQQLEPRTDGDSICIAEYPKPESFDPQVIRDASIAQEVISQIRNIRNNRGMSPKTAVPLAIRTQNQAVYEQFGQLIGKLANVSALVFTADKVEGALSFMVKTDECFVTLEQDFDVEAEIEKTQKELDYDIGSREIILKKLNNEKFVANAKPAVVENERKKLADVEAKIKTLEQRLADLRR